MQWKRELVRAPVHFTSQFIRDVGNDEFEKLQEFFRSVEIVYIILYHVTELASVLKKIEKYDAVIFCDYVIDSDALDRIHSDLVNNFFDTVCNSTVYKRLLDREPIDIYDFDGNVLTTVDFDTIYELFGTDLYMSWKEFVTEIYSKLSFQQDS